MIHKGDLGLTLLLAMLTIENSPPDRPLAGFFLQGNRPQQGVFHGERTISRLVGWCHFAV
jgi:hypothetical protein